MSSAEIANASAIPAREIVEAAEVQEAAVSPARPADAELTLRSFELYTPTQPISISGQAYSVSVDTETLTTAINKVAKNTYIGTKDLYPRQVVIGVSTGQSTVEIGEDLQPKIIDPSVDKKTPTLTPFEDDGTSVNITLPSELISTEYSESGLVELITRQANKDLFIAIGQNLQVKRKFRFGMRMSSLVLAAGIGEGAAVATSDNVISMIANGAVGAALGGAVGIAGILAADKLRWGKAENFPSWAIKKSREYQEINWRLEDLAKSSVISLSAVQPEQPDTL